MGRKRASKQFIRCRHGRVTAGLCRAMFVSVALATAVLTASGQVTGRNVSKVGTTAAPFLEIPVGGRAVGMGSAFVGTADDATSLFWNPAGAARLEQGDAVFSHSNWFADVSFDYAAAAMPLGEFGSLGLSFMSLGTEDMAVRTVERPEGTGEMFSVGSFAVGLHYARNLSDRFSIGFSAKYISENIWNMNAQAFAFDVGVLFTTTFFNGLRVGATITNFGTDMQLTGRDTRTFHSIDPQKLGSNSRIPQNIELDQWPLPLNFQFGLATEVLNSEDHKLTIALDALHPSDNYESLNAGFEYGFRRYFYVRAGYRSLFLIDGEGGLSAGVGLTSALFGGDVRAKVDFAYLDYGRLGSIDALTLSVLF